MGGIRAPPFGYLLESSKSLRTLLTLFGLGCLFGVFKLTDDVVELVFALFKMFKLELDAARLSKQALACLTLVGMLSSLLVSIELDHRPLLLLYEGLNLEMVCASSLATDELDADDVDDEASEMRLDEVDLFWIRL